MQHSEEYIKFWKELVQRYEDSLQKHQENKQYLEQRKREMLHPLEQEEQGHRQNQDHARGRCCSLSLLDSIDTISKIFDCAIASIQSNCDLFLNLIQQSKAMLDDDHNRPETRILNQ